MRLNPPKKVTIMVAAALVVIGIIIAIIGKPVLAFVFSTVAAALVIAGCFVKGL